MGADLCRMGVRGRWFLEPGTRCATYLEAAASYSSMSIADARAPWRRCRRWVKLSASIGGDADRAVLIALVRLHSIDTSIPPKTSPSTFEVRCTASCCNKWYWDEVCTICCSCAPAFALGRFFWKRGDEQTIDRFGPNGRVRQWVVACGSRGAVRLQSGYTSTPMRFDHVDRPRPPRTTWAIAN